MVAQVIGKNVRCYFMGHGVLFHVIHVILFAVISIRTGSAIHGSITTRAENARDRCRTGLTWPKVRHTWPSLANSSSLLSTIPERRIYSFGWGTSRCQTSTSSRRWTTIHRWTYPGHISVCSIPLLTVILENSTLQCVLKTIHLTFDHNFGKCGPIYKMLSMPVSWKKVCAHTLSRFFVSPVTSP